MYDVISQEALDETHHCSTRLSVSCLALTGATVVVVEPNRCTWEVRGESK